MGEEKRGTVPGFVHREEHVVSNQPQSDWKEETGGRESRGLRAARRSARSLCYSVGSSSRGQLVCLLAGLLSVCNLLVLLPSSLPG